MTRTQRLTMVLMISVTVALVLYNIAILAEPSPDDAISHLMLRGLTNTLTVGWALGVTVGHWAVPWNYPHGSYKRNAGVALLALSAVVVALDVWTDFRLHPTLMFAIGFLNGVVLWPQRPRR